MRSEPFGPQAARILEKKSDDADRCLDLALHIKDVFNNEFLDAGIHRATGQKEYVTVECGSRKHHFTATAGRGGM